MITPEQIDAHEFTTTRLRAGYDPDEVDNYLDRVIVDYRAALSQVGVLQQQIANLTHSPTQQIPAVYSDMDKLLAVAQQHADQTIGEANGQAGKILAEADAQSRAIVDEGRNEKNRILGELTSKREELEQAVAQAASKRNTAAETLRQALVMLGAGE